MIASWLHRAGTVSLRGLVAFGRFWYGFIIGDDWTVAAAVAAALVVTWLLHTAGVAALWAQATDRRGLRLWATLAKEADRLGELSLDVGSGMIQAPQ